MRIATIPYNFQSSNFEHVNKHFHQMDYTQSKLFPYTDQENYLSTDNTTFSSSEWGVGDNISRNGNIYAQEMEAGFVFTRAGNREADGVTRIGPELEGDNQFKLKDVSFKNEGLTGTWLSDVIGLMYKFSTRGSHNRDNCGLIRRIGICYLDTYQRKLVTYTAKHLVTGLQFASRPDDSSKIYDTAVVIDTGPKNEVIDKQLKFAGIVVQHQHRHSAGGNTLTGRIWNLRPIVVNDKRDWNLVRDDFVLNANASGKKIIVPHNNTSWSDYNSGSYQIKTF